MAAGVPGKFYPRAWPPGSPPLQTLFGPAEFDQVFPSTPRSTRRVWIANGVLPAADGPDVNGGPTWTRDLFLIWAYSRNMTPVHLLAETHDILARPGAQEKLEQCMLSKLLKMT